MNGYVKELVILMIKRKAENAAKEIGFPYSEGVEEQIYLDVFHEFNLKSSCSVDTIEESVNAAIKQWQKETKQNFPEMCEED